MGSIQKEQAQMKEEEAREQAAASLPKDRVYPVRQAVLRNARDAAQDAGQGAARVKRRRPAATREELENLLRRPWASDQRQSGQDADGKSCANKTDLQKLETQLINADFERANIAPYPKDFADRSRGHWDLAEPLETSAGAVLNLSANAYYARPPQLDVDKSATCAIDFGTKSTVVVCHKGGEDKAERVGRGNYDDAAQPDDYENPTVICLHDLPAFQKAYEARAGRPFTRWEDLTVSHQAAGALKDFSGDSRVFDAIFSELKQWANANSELKINLLDQKGHPLFLRPYLELSEGDFDPIEVYAYYLGLYINNMTKGICLDYILSYPVTYERDVREKIRASIERGLKKSLPPAILRDEEMMRRFHVRKGADEAIAYALCALRDLHLEPQEKGGKVAFAVFDFGGGTTDCCFGVETRQEGRFLYEAEEYDDGGNPLLGGENLLELLAYETYVGNLDEMRKNGIVITRPPKTKQPSGTEKLILAEKDASRAARLNMKMLVEVLRPFWERESTEEEPKIFEEAPTVKLCGTVQTAQGEKKEQEVTVPLNVDEPHLLALLKERIRQGIENFFDKCDTAFSGRYETLPIHILLGGNGSKSVLVRDLLEKGMAAAEARTQQQLAAAGKERSLQNLFCLHLPEEPAEDVPLDERHTGKTGVAFGLLRTLPKSRDVKIRNAEKEASFRYVLGKIRDDMFEPYGEDAGYGEWFEFEYADQDIVTLWFTEEQRAAEGGLRKGELAADECDLLLDADEVQEGETAEEVKLFLRKKGPDTIEYAVGRAEDFAQEFSGKTHGVSLK